MRHTGQPGLPRGLNAGLEQGFIQADIKLDKVHPLLLLLVHFGLHRCGGLHRHRQARERRGVNQRAGGVHPRAGHLAGGHAIAVCHIEFGVAAGVAHRGDAMGQHHQAVVPRNVH